MRSCIAWHASSESVVSDMRLMNLANGCVDTATCDYGMGTHNYEYDDALAPPTARGASCPASRKTIPTRCRRAE